jgi:uncharacterized protein (DUF2141 family)
VIHGEVLYDGPARGDAILLLFDTNALPPPDGNGAGAMAVVRVPQAVLFQQPPGARAGRFSAPFTFTQVPSGSTYRIRSFIDATHHFAPFFDYAQQPRAGDPAGASPDIAVAAAQIVSGVQVALTQEMAYDPPSFELVGGSRTLETTLDQPARLKLRIAHLPGPAASFGNAHFALELDRDAQGNRRSSFGDGLDDVFPRVFLRQLTDEREAPLRAAAAAIVPCRVISLSVLPALVNRGVDAPAIAQDSIEALIEPFAVRATDSAPLPTIPAGRYQVVVVQRSGQTWTVPNQLGDEGNAATPYFAPSQGESIAFVSPVLPPNSVSGTVTWTGGPSIRSGNIVVQAYRDDPDDPPPPLGAALPVRAQLIPARAVVGDGRAFRASYRIEGLPAGSYVIQALDDVDANFSPLNLLRTATSGDLAGAVLDPATGRPASVPVRGDVSGKDIALARLTVDPPAFEIDPATTAQMPADQATPLRFRIRAKPLAFPAGKAPAPHFAVQLVRDSDGSAVDADHDGIPDVWPRVLLVRLDPSDPSGLTQYLSPGPHPSGAQVMLAAVDPTPFLPALQPQPGGNPPAILTDRLEIIVRPALYERPTAGGLTKRVPMQAGAYRVVLVSQTGQVWQIPNEAGSSALDPAVLCDEKDSGCSAGTAPTRSQSDAFRVGPPSRRSPAGAIAGSLTTTATSIAAAYVLLYAADRQPPFGSPVAVDFHPATDFQGGRLEYLLPNLPSGDYVVTAIVDTGGDFAPSLPVVAMAPGPGDLKAAAAKITVATSTVIQDLAAVIAIPPRPSFLVPSWNPGAEIDLAFNGAAVASMLVQFTPILSAKLRALHPDAAAGLALACGSNGKPLTASASIAMVKLAGDATGLFPELDGQGMATVLSGALDATQLASATCTPGSFYTVSGPVTVALQRSSSAKINLLDPRVSPIAIPLVPGRYALSITSAAGQTWRVPNELQPALLDPATLPATPADAQFLLRTQQVAVNVIP